MKIVQINTTTYGSTGKIMLQLANIAQNVGKEIYTVSKSWHCIKYKNVKHLFAGNFVENIFYRIFAPIFSFDGNYGKFATKRLIKKLKKIKPDIIHLHNLHGWYLDLGLLFSYIKEEQIRVIWTLHDCWAFTGHCPHFDMIACEKWKLGCQTCSQYKTYPKTFIDRSKKAWKLKKQCFTGIKDLTIITPSKWLANLVKQSFLKDYPVKVINNGIDLNVFKPTESDFREKHSLEEKFIILGVAFGWGERKGLDVFIELSNRLDDRFQIVLVGTDDKVDKLLPKNIISIHRTQNQTELAEIYSSADIFINPTREDNYPTVNMESLACGTPVVTFNTGGSPELLDETCGIVVEKNDINGIECAILRQYNERNLKKEDCTKKAKDFDKNEKFSEYIQLYERITCK